jgi:dTDP-4-dehydrorhamnose 3,5-epimerase
MRFLETKLPGAFVIELERHQDERGFFARSFCEREFGAHGLARSFVQCNVSYNRRRGTLRGMHYQATPHREAKLVRCTAGSIWDAIVDLRPSSPAHLSWTAVELSAENRRMLYVPEGFGHGFQTLSDDAEVCYQMSHLHVPEAGRGFRWNDPRFAIPWPLEVGAISQKDRELPGFDPGTFDG